MDEKMNIATALNKKYVPYATVMLLSLCENNKEHVDAYLLNSELNDEDLNIMRSELKGHDITVYSVRIDRDRFEKRLPVNDQWSIEMYYRLLMIEVIPKSIDRILYLDVDIIVNLSIHSFYQACFNGKELLVSDDKGGKNDPSGYGPKNREMLNEAYNSGHRYFNSGVMLMNLSLLRQKYSFKTYTDAIREWNYEMEAPDQDILNWVHWRNVGFVDYRIYDYFSRVAHNDGVRYTEAKEKIAIIHFAGAKPWEYKGFHYDLEKLWWDYAKQTSFYTKFLEDFIQASLMDTTIEDYLIGLENSNSMLKEKLNSMTVTLKKYIG